MTSFAKIREWLWRRAENLLALVLASLFVSFLIQIVFRYLLNLPLGWTVEYVSIAWLWGILFGYAFVIRDEEIIRLDIIYGTVPPAIRRAMDIFSGLVCAGIFAWSLPKVFDYVTFMAVEKTAFMHIPFDWVFSVYLAFAVAVIVRCLLGVWHGFRGTHPKYHFNTPESHDYD